MVQQVSQGGDKEPMQESEEAAYPKRRPKSHSGRIGGGLFLDGLGFRV